MTRTVAVALAVGLTVSLVSCSGRTEELWVSKVGLPIVAGALLSDDKLAVLTSTGVNILNSETGEAISRIEAGGIKLRSIACDLTTCWVGGGEHAKGYLGVLDLERRAITRRGVLEEFAAVSALTVMADGRVATAHDDETVIVWEEKEERAKTRLVIREGREIHALASLGGDVVFGNDRGELVVWDGRSDMPAQGTNLRDGAILSITTTGGRVFAGGWQYLDVLTRRLTAEKRHVDLAQLAILACDGSADGQTLWCGGSDGTVIMIETESLRRTPSKRHADAISFVKLLGRTVLTASRDGTVKAWRAIDVRR